MSGNRLSTVYLRGWRDKPEEYGSPWCLRHSLLIRQPICVRAATRTMTARLG